MSIEWVVDYAMTMQTIQGFTLPLPLLRAVGMGWILLLPKLTETVLNSRYSKGYTSSDGNYSKNDLGIKPEIKKEFEVGTGWSFLKDRLTTSFTYYTNVTEGIIFL